MQLSIITINYNNREGLIRTIESVESQTWHDFEWIIIDGGSTDGSKELIEEHASSFAYWVSEPDKGIYNAMNKGIRHAQGEWLQFLNSGDWLCEPNTLKNAFDKPFSGDIVYGNVVLIDSEGMRHPCEFIQPISLSFFFVDNINHQSTFIRRELFSTGLYDENYRIVSDWAKWIEWLMEGRRFEHLPLFVCNFDLTGIGNKEKDLHDSEMNLVFNNLIPSYLKPDMEKLVQYEKSMKLIRKRKTLSRWSKRFYKLCIWTDSVLHNIEKLRKSFKRNNNKSAR